MARRKEMLPIGTNPIYDKAYDRLRLTSNILNAGNILNTDNRINPNSESELKRAKLNISENLPELENELVQIDQLFKVYQQERVNKGFDRPKDMLPDMKQKKLEILAKIDVSKEEVSEVERLLKKLTESKIQLRKSTVLPRGLMQNYHCNHDGIIEIIDGQLCSVIRGIVTIDDELSPYDGLPVVEYRKIASEWHKEYTERINENERRRDEAILNHKEAQFLPKFPPFPKYPEGVKSMKQKDKATA